LAGAYRTRGYVRLDYRNVKSEPPVWYTRALICMRAVNIVMAWLIVLGLLVLYMS